MSDCTKPEDNGWCATRLACFKELGWALFYTMYLHDGWEEGQKRRIGDLCRESVANNDVAADAYWQHLLKRIEDETENLC